MKRERRAEEKDNSTIYQQTLAQVKSRKKGKKRSKKGGMYCRKTSSTLNSCKP